MFTIRTLISYPTKTPLTRQTFSEPVFEYDEEGNKVRLHNKPYRPSGDEAQKEADGVCKERSCYQPVYVAPDGKKHKICAKCRARFAKYRAGAAVRRKQRSQSDRAVRVHGGQQTEGSDNRTAARGGPAPG